MPISVVFLACDGKIVNSGSGPLLVLYPDRRLLPRWFLINCIVAGVGTLILFPGIYFDGQRINPLGGAILILASVPGMVAHVAHLVCHRPTLVAQNDGVILNRGMARQFGPVLWSEVSRFRAILGEGGEAEFFVIDLKDPPATHLRLGRTWSGLLRWLTTFGTPLRLRQTELDRPIETVVQRLNEIHREKVSV